MKTITTFYVLLCGRWVKCKTATPCEQGWLEYELRDSTVGLAQPEKWYSETIHEMTTHDRIQLSIARATLSLIDELAGFSPMTKQEAGAVVEHFKMNSHA